MPLRKCLESRLSEIRSIIEKEIIEPKIPVPIFIAEAYMLYEACQPDREALRGVGLVWGIVEDLPHRVMACLAAYAQWRAAETVLTPAQQEYRRNMQQGWEVLDEIRQAVLYACRIRGTKPPASLKRSCLRPKDIILVKELSVWAEYADSIKTDLESICFDMSKIEFARKFVPKLRAAIAQQQVEQPAETAELIKRQACAWLYRTVETIRAAGKHAFRHNPEKRKVYESEYRRMHRNKGFRRSTVANLQDTQEHSKNRE